MPGMVDLQLDNWYREKICYIESIHSISIEPSFTFDPFHLSNSTILTLADALAELYFFWHYPGMICTALGRNEARFLLCSTSLSPPIPSPAMKGTPSFSILFPFVIAKAQFSSLAAVTTCWENLQRPMRRLRWKALRRGIRGMRGS